MIMREIDPMAHELAALIETRPMCAVGLGELAEDDFQRVAYQLHRILRARNARLEVAKREIRVRVAQRVAADAKTAARRLQRAAEEGAAI